MNQNLPLVYVVTLLLILIVAATLIIKEVVKARLSENTFSKLQKKLKNSKGSAEDYYQLGSLYLDKKLFVQSINLFEKALRAEKQLPPENEALIHNAMGFAYFAQEQYDIAIRKYKEALKLYPEYVVALNNLGNVYEKKQLISQSVEAYETALKYEPENKTAKRRVESLKKRLVSNS